MKNILKLILVGVISLTIPIAMIFLFDYFMPECVSYCIYSSECNMRVMFYYFVWFIGAIAFWLLVFRFKVKNKKNKRGKNE